MSDIFARPHFSTTEHDGTVVPFKLTISLLVKNLLPLYEKRVFFVTQQPNAGLGSIIVGVLDRRHPHTHTIGLLCTSDHPVAWTATYTTHNVHKRRIFMPSAAFELAMQAVEVLQTYALDRTTTRIGPKIV
jgi:hypothetical protein